MGGRDPLGKRQVQNRREHQRPARDPPDAETDGLQQGVTDGTHERPVGRVHRFPHCVPRRADDERRGAERDRQHDERGSRDGRSSIAPRPRGGNRVEDHHHQHRDFVQTDDDHDQNGGKRRVQPPSGATHVVTSRLEERRDL